MKNYKNVNSINEVKEVLKNLQDLYTKKDMSKLDDFAREAFSLKDGAIVLGSEMNQWCFDVNDIKELIRSHWNTENNYWKEMDFKFDEARIFADGNTAWVISIGNIRNTITEDRQMEETITKVKDVLKREEQSKENALYAVRKIANTLKEIEKGENYVWPFRFTCVLIKENNSWKFHQMQFSLDSESFKNRFIDENYDKSIFEMSKASSNEEIEEIKKVLQVFQEGYTKRDVNHVDEYMKEVFLLDDDLVVIGTDADELCLGVDAARGIVESDWKYWGNFKMNYEDAIICVNDEVAYFTTKAILSRTITTETIIQWISGSAKYRLGCDGKSKDKLIEILCDTLDLLYENERGEIFITPMRFSGVLVKKDERWLIQHAQYSDYADKMPEVRK